MFQQIVCKISQCPFCSQSGFCLNRLVVINEQGVCKHLTRPDWQDAIAEEFKSNYRPPVKEIEDKENAGVGDEIAESGVQEG